jgi:hypothetical protein
MNSLRQVRPNPRYQGGSSEQAQAKAAAIVIVALVTVTFVLWLCSWFAPRPPAKSIPQVED